MRTFATLGKHNKMQTLVNFPLRSLGQFFATFAAKIFKKPGITRNFEDQADLRITSNRLPKSVFLLVRLPAHGLTWLARMGRRLGDTIHLLQLFTLGALGSAIALAPGVAQDREICPAFDDSGPMIT